MVYKLFTFQFINTYSCLLYIAFVKPYGEYNDLTLWGQHDGCVRGTSGDDETSCYEQLKLQYMGIIIAKVAVDFVLDLVKPCIKKYINMVKLTGKIDANTKIDAMNDLEHELIMEPYSSTTTDFNQLVLTFGFIAMFGVAWPFGATALALYGVLQNFADSQKILDLYQRPRPQEQDNLGAWKRILWILAAIGCLTNAGILAYTMDWFRHHYSSMNDYDILWAGVICEHIVLVLWFVILHWIPSEPSFLERKRALDAFEAEMYGRPWKTTDHEYESESDDGDHGLDEGVNEGSSMPMVDGKGNEQRM